MVCGGVIVDLGWGCFGCFGYWVCGVWNGFCEYYDYGVGCVWFCDCFVVVDGDFFDFWFVVLDVWWDFYWGYMYVGYVEYDVDFNNGLFCCCGFIGGNFWEYGFLVGYVV